VSSTFKKPLLTGSGKVPLVAVVDDDESVRLAVHRLVCAAGMNAVDYASGEELIRDFCEQRAQRVDCIVLDLQMLGMNGLQTAEWLTQFGVQTPMVFISGGDENTVRALGGPSDLPWIRKPFDDAVLLPAIEAALKVNEVTRLRGSC
jgi:FixJ family two-component response regulator